MGRFGFCGPAYKAQNLSADAQECINLFLERDESGAGKSEFNLLGTPGLQLHTPFNSHFSPGTPGAFRGGINASGVDQIAIGGCAEDPSPDALIIEDFFGDADGIARHL